MLDDNYRADIDNSTSEDRLDEVPGTKGVDMLSMIFTFSYKITAKSKTNFT